MKLLFILLVFGLVLISGCTRSELFNFFDQPTNGEPNSEQTNIEPTGSTETPSSVNGNEKPQPVPSNLLKLGEYRSGEADLILNTDKATAIQFDLVHEGLNFKELVLVQGIDKQASLNKIGSKTKIVIVGLNTDEFPRGKIGTLKLTGNGLLSLENVVVPDENGIQIQDT